MIFRRMPVRTLRGWKVATIRGVDLKLHVSLLFLLAYVVFIAAAQLPFVIRASGIPQEMISGPPVLWGLIFAFALFLSVVLHEFGHVITAQRMGVKVEGVTLMMLGGVSEMERIPETRLSEFKVSIIGPIVSFAIAGALFALRAASLSPEVSFFAYWLARVNLVLGIFNLLPIFPLDGGRAFRSLLSTRMSASRATGVAVKVAKGSAWVLGGLGILGFNLLLILIAFFIYSAANSELVMDVNRRKLRGVPARELMTEMHPLTGEETLLHAVNRMMASRTRILPVETAEGAGVVGMDDLRRIPRDRWAETRVKSAMDKTPVVLDLNDPLEEHFPQLITYGALPVTKAGQVVGLVRQTDIAELLEFRNLTGHDGQDRAA